MWSGGDAQASEIRIIGSDASIKLPATPVHLTCGRDRAHRPVVAMRWPDAAADNQATREPKPMPVFLWDGHSPKLSPVVDSATGETLSAHTVAVSDSQVDARGGSGVLICAADGRLWACDTDGLARPCFARSPSPSLAPSVVFVKLACGGAHALALTADGRLYAWGSNGRGQLGMGDDIDRTEPTPVSLERAADAAVAVVVVSASGAASAGGLRGSIRAQASAVRQGSAESAPGGHAAITRIAAALMHSAAVSSVGTLFTWGDGGDGRLGLNDPSCHRCT
jgi:alpha-tubulin suppressor-like RCC1 family protein